jgi:hypothetical protein
VTREARLRLLAARIGSQIKGMLPRLMPSGGTAGQVLAKTSSNDYAAAWIDNNPKPMGLATIGASGIATSGAPMALSANVSGAKAGDILLFVPTVCPADRQTGQCRCDQDGVVKIWVSGPALTILTSFTITGMVLKLR